MHVLLEMLLLDELEEIVGHSLCFVLAQSHIVRVSLAAIVVCFQLFFVCFFLIWVKALTPFDLIHEV